MPRLPPLEWRQRNSGGGRGWCCSNAAGANQHAAGTAHGWDSAAEAKAVWKPGQVCSQWGSFDGCKPALLGIAAGGRRCYQGAVGLNPRSIEGFPAPLLHGLLISQTGWSVLLKPGIQRRVNGQMQRWVPPHQPQDREESVPGGLPVSATGHSQARSRWHGQQREPGGRRCCLSHWRRLSTLRCCDPPAAEIYPVAAGRFAATAQLACE